MVEEQEKNCSSWSWCLVGFKVKGSGADRVFAGHRKWHGVVAGVREGAAHFLSRAGRHGRAGMLEDPWFRLMRDRRVGGRRSLFVCVRERGKRLICE